MVWWCALPIRGVQWSDVSFATVLVWPTSSHVHVASRTPYSNLTHEQSQLAHQQFSLASNTTRTYQSHWRIFMSICQDYGVDFSQAMTEENLCLVVAAYADSHKITTLPQFISALQYFHVRCFRCNLPRGVMFSDMQRGLDNYYANRAVVQRKHALTLNDLLAFAPLLDTRYFEHARDWCACLLAFFGLLRIGEYMDGRLHHRHIQITPHGVIITIAFSKTSNLPATVTIAQRDDRLCPASALAH